MFLKRIEIVGFKSFANKVVINCNDGVTAIVGPNGSGKSNIMDAVRWVLGEQSVKSLRGVKMNDVIFAGSESRKRLNFAEVSLILDNRQNYLPIDFQEVMLTRRVYRSGESEYLLNKVVCRLKDIVDLFTDTGLGKFSFTIIEQGKIDEIMNNKPEDRRAIFEEVAGVLKYKNRKEKAEHNLSETLLNLQRVHDIMNEIENQLKPLASQAELAKGYLAKKELLEKKELTFLVNEIVNNYEKWNENKVAVDKYKDLEIDYSSKMIKLENALATLRLEKKKHEGKNEHILNELQKYRSQLEQITGKKLVFTEKIKHLIENEEKWQTEIITLKKTENLIIAKIKELQINITINKEEIIKLEENGQQKLQYKNIFAKNLRDIEEKQQELFAERNAQLKYEQEIDWLQIQNNENNSNVKTFNENLVQLKNKKDELEQELNVINQSLQAFERSCQENTVLREETERTLLNIEKMHEHKNNDYTSVHMEYQKLIAKKEALQEMTSDYQGYYHGVRAILRERNKQLLGIYGVVAESMSIEGKYITALEIILSSALQNIIVYREEDARLAIKFLKDNQFGRATFLPIETIKGRLMDSTVRAKLANNNSFIGLGIDLVQYDDKIINIMQYLLGQIIVAQTLLGASELAKISQYRYRIVTIDGDVINSGGAITGGKVKKTNSSPLAKNNELDKLTAHVQEFSNKYCIVKEEYVRIEQLLRNIRENLVKIEQEERNFFAEINILQEKIAIITVKLANYNENIANIKENIQSLGNETRKNQARIDELVAVAHNTVEQINQLEIVIKQLELQKLENQSEQQLLEERKNTFLINSTKKNEQLSYQKRELQRLENEKIEIKEQLKLCELNLAQLQDKNELENTLELCNSDFEKVTIENNKLQLQFEQLKRETNQLINEIEQAEREIKALQRQYRETNDILKKAEIFIAQLDTVINQQMLQLGSKHKLTFEAAEKLCDCDEEINFDLLNFEIEQLQAEILDMGTVNEGAINEFARITERYEFLQTQKKDLEEGSSALQDIINTMDTEMINRFQETFHLVNNEFKQIFPKLFGGGSAELSLSDPENLLKTGIDIAAQPPGKKRQSLRLLSGGERALTSLVILFAILKVKPVPFCILDEVEAELDEVNVWRFSQYIKEFSNETQFIVITHRKVTMEAADVLYGITMNEPGISQLVSVRLTEG